MENKTPETEKNGKKDKGTKIRKKPSKNSKLYKVFESLDPEEDYVAIFLQSEPDPDAMGSALGIKWLLSRHFNLTSHLFFPGNLSDDPQNSAMQNTLGISLKGIDDYIKDKGKYKKGVIVDGNPKSSKIDPNYVDVIIDHHSFEGKENDYDYTNIKQVGSCCSMVCELISNSEYFFDSDNEEDCMVATALLIGIRIDTNSLLSESVTKLEYDSWSKLLPYVDKTKMTQILNYPLPKYYYDLRFESYKDENQRDFGSNYFVAGVGFLVPKRRGVIPRLADEYLRMPGVNTVLVFGIVGGCVDISVRSDDTTLDINAFCKKLFGDDAGGKFGAGRGRIPLGFLGSMDGSSENNDKLWMLVKKQVFDLIEKELGGN